MTKRVEGWVAIGAAILLAPYVTVAQEAGVSPDIGTSTPPELRDFRLDAPPPRQAPEQNPSQPTPNPEPATQSPETRSETRPAFGEQNTPARAPTRPAERIAEQSPSETVTAEPTASESTDTDVPALPDENPGIETASTRTVTTPEGSQGVFIWIAAALGAFLTLAATALLLRRRRNQPPATRNAAVPKQQPSPPTRLGQSKPAPAHKRATEPSARRDADMVFAEFKPDSAQLSIASLSVTGKLTITNNGRLAVDGLMLRSHMISAQSGQKEAIASFHDARDNGSLQSLGPLAPGERIDAVIEIRQPRNALFTFRWAEREFVAPIILINLSGHAGDAAIDVQLSHLIGREGSDPSARMKPLPIDRGPQRFTGVSARLLFA